MADSGLKRVYEKDFVIDKIIIGSFAIAAILSLWLWLSAGLPMLLKERVPGMDNAGQNSATGGSRTGPVGVLTTATGIPADLKGAWPCFRGENLDNISKDVFTPLPVGAGFPELWAIDVGEGHAGATIWDGRVYLMDYDRENSSDALRCLSLADGQEIWRYAYPVRVKRNHGMSRTTPYVTENFVVSLGPKCHVTCLNSISGEKKWSLDLVQAYGAKVPPWYAGQCPLVDQNRVILAPGGSSLMIAVDPETGETIWETPNPNDWKMTHTSIMPMDFKGKRIYVYCASGGITGVSAEDGSILWESSEWKIRIANVPSPVVVGEGLIFLCGGYEAGSMMMQLEEKDGRIIPKSLFRMPPERFGSAQQTPIFYKGYIYGVRPDGQLVCFDLEGNEKWTSTSAYKFGMGPYAIVGSQIYVMNDSGLLSRVAADSKEFRLLDQTQVLHGHDSWGPIAYASGRMILRDLTKMVCLDTVAR